MKPLRVILVAALVAALADAVLPAQSPGGSAQAVAPPEVVIKEFYRWYVRSISRGQDPFKQGRPTLRKYVTPRLIQQVERAEQAGTEAIARRAA